MKVWNVYGIFVDEYFTNEKKTKKLVEKHPTLFIDEYFTTEKKAKKLVEKHPNLNLKIITDEINFAYWIYLKMMGA